MKGAVGIMGREMGRNKDMASHFTNSNVPVLTQILLEQEKEDVSHEQTQRILKPVLEKINGGSFDRLHQKGSKWFL